MTRSIQICMILVIIQWLVCVNSVPLLQGISIKRNFDISLKPFQFKPIIFTREKWGPFGAYGRRHSITRRQADSINNVPNPVIPLVSNLGPGVLPPPAPVTVPSVLNNEIFSPSSISPISTIIPLQPISPAPVYENIPDGPNFLTPLTQVNSASSTLLSNVTPQPTQIQNSFFQPSSIGAVPVSDPPLMSNPTIITPPPVTNRIGSTITPFRFNTAITESRPVNPFSNLINLPPPPPIFESGPRRVNLLVPNIDQTQLANPEIPPSTRRGILARFGEFFLQLLTRFVSTTRFSRDSLSSKK